MDNKMNFLGVDMEILTPDTMLNKAYEWCQAFVQADQHGELFTVFANMLVRLYTMKCLVESQQSAHPQGGCYE